MLRKMHRLSGTTAKQHCDVVIVCLEDMTDSILATLNLGNMGVRKLFHGPALQNTGKFWRNWGRRLSIRKGIWR